jgi:hypothetical protein
MSDIQSKDGFTFLVVFFGLISPAVRFSANSSSIARIALIEASKIWSPFSRAAAPFDFQPVALKLARWKMLV